MEQLHQAGCVPVTWPQAGMNTVTYRGDGQEACAGQTATVTYDATPGVDDPVVIGQVFDLDDGTYTVNPAYWCGQVDVWVGDVTHVINTPRWNPAYRLLTVRYPNAPCAPPTTTVTRVTPAPTVPVTVPPTLESAPPTTGVPGSGGSTTTTPPVEVGPPTPPAIGLVADGPQLPVTGSATRTLAVIGFVLMSGGSAILVGCVLGSWLRRRGR